MHRNIALLANQIQFGQDARPDQLLERRLEEKADQIVFVGGFESGVRPVQPVDQRLNCAPCVKDS